ncbi:hypothetical protein [Alkalihalobacterium chitinilyticum]|uniref:Uncharacterized protein n=1 Tax=Alkalihalobacterium chitinilyticum TaxID=2980103 RepID=A0ABT5VDY5_9BACI|nr:hypothetical protein [Alkalihalobacterium chitinilyticum]MDE5412693.1 hypothetical protein [Alkalihalobacterium chitinilyticum]
MKSNDTSTKKLVEKFISTVLKQNNIDPKSQLSKAEKQEIKKIITDCHNQVNVFLAKKGQFVTENDIQPSPKKVRPHKHKVIAANDFNTLKMFQGSIINTSSH